MTLQRQVVMLLLPHKDHWLKNINRMQYRQVCYHTQHSLRFKVREFTPNVIRDNSLVQPCVMTMVFLV
jgi:hypothetical protein